jgi:hypothetical protein
MHFTNRAPSLNDSGATNMLDAGAPGLESKKELLEREFYDWWAHNDYLLRVGLPGDVEDLRLRLNAAFAKSRRSSRGAPNAS